MPCWLRSCGRLRGRLEADTGRQRLADSGGLSVVGASSSRMCRTHSHTAAEKGLAGWAEFPQRETLNWRCSSILSEQ